MSKNRFFSIVFIIIMAIPFRFWFSYGPFNTISILDIWIWLLFFMFLITFDFRVFNQTSKMVFILLCIPLIICIISLIWTENVLSTIKAVYYHITSLLAYYMSINLLKKEDSKFIVNLLGLFVIISLIFSFSFWIRLPFILDISKETIVDLYSFNPHEYASIFARLNHPFIGRSNDFAAVLLVTIPFFFGITYNYKTYKNLYFLLGFIASIGVILTFSRGVIICLIIVCIIILFSQLSFRLFIFFILFCIITLYSVFLFSQEVRLLGIDILDNRANIYTGLISRINYFENAINLINNSPFLGYGGGRYLAFDTHSLNAAVHNTFLEQIISYGVFFGNIVNISFLCLPLPFIFYKVKNYKIKKVCKFVAISIYSFYAVSLMETSNEAIMPKYIFNIFLAFFVIYLKNYSHEIDVNT